MIKENIVNENIPTEYLLEEFDNLISCKSLGNYNCCEMISIYLWDKDEKMSSNLYTICVFEERVSANEKSEYLLDKLERINDKYSLGILKKIFSVGKIRHIFEILCTQRNNKYVDIGEGNLQIGHLESVPKVFVQQDSTLEILLND